MTEDHVDPRFIVEWHRSLVQYAWAVPILRELADKYRGRDDAEMLSVLPITAGLVDEYALCLVLYALDTKRWEVVWNARNGPPPCELNLAATGEIAPLLPFPMFTPNYVPSIGERVVIDLTEARARMITREGLDDYERERPAEYAELRAVCERRSMSRDQFIEERAMEIYRRGIRGDVVTVNAGYLDELAHDRRTGRMPVFVRDAAGLGQCWRPT